MKKILSIFLLAAFCTVFSTTALAYDFSAVNSDGVTIYYKKTSSTTVAVTYKKIPAILIQQKP